MSAIDEFFARYEEGANSFDPDLVCSQYTPEFMGGGPDGVAIGRNDANLREAMVDRRAFFEEIGFRRAKILDIAQTPLDDKYTLAKVHWHMVFEKEPGTPQGFRFYITYVLFDDGDGPKVAFWVSHEDERKTMHEAGLI